MFGPLGAEAQTFFEGLTHLTVEELTDLYHTPVVVESLEETTRTEHYLLIATQLHLHGSAGRRVLWDELERADLEQRRAILTALAFEPRDASRLRRTLHKFLESDDPEKIQTAVEAISFSRDRKARKRILPLADRPEPGVQTAVLNYLTYVFPTEALQPLLNACRHESIEVRRAAVGYLLQLRIVDTSQQVAGAMAKMHKDRDHAVRDYARALLNGILPSSDELSTLIAEVLEYVIELGRDPTWRDVEREDRKPEWSEPHLPMIALIARDPDNPNLRKRLDEWLRSDDEWQVSIAIYALTILGDRKDEDEILALRKSPNDLVSAAAHTYERMFDAPAALRDYRALLDSEVAEDRLIGIEGLTQLMTAEVDPDVRAQLEAMRDDPDEEIRESVEYALAIEWDRRFGELGNPY